MSLFDRIERLMGAQPKSKNDAKQRLKLVLLHDQCDISPAKLEAMREEIVAVMQKYVDIDREAIDFKLHKENGKIALVSTVGVNRVNSRQVA